MMSGAVPIEARGATGLWEWQVKEKGGTATADGSGEERRKRRTTMAEVASLAKVSQSTVSLVLNGVENARITPATRRRVIEAAEALQYRFGPRPVAAVEGPPIIGMMIDDLSPNWIGAALIDDIRDFCWDMGALLVVTAAGGRPEIEELVLRHLLRQAPVGVIYASLYPRRVTPPAGLAQLRSVLVNCGTVDDGLPSVMPDFRQAGFAATDRMVAAGHRRIAFLNHERWHHFAQDRQDGYRQALARAGIAYDRQLVRHGSGSPEAGYRDTLELMRLPEPPTAIVCANDRLAFGCLDALKALGRSIPDEVAVIGYDDHELARHCHPGLTTLATPHVEMARWAVDHLLSGTADGEGIPRIRLESRLVERYSVGPVIRPGAASP